LSAQPAPPGLDRVPLGDKEAHVLAFAILGATLAWGNVRSGSELASVLMVGLGVLYGVLDEWHQSFVPGRVVSVADWVADIIGVVLGYFAVRMILSRLGPSSRADKQT
jgi:VanZ family protein